MRKGSLLAIALSLVMLLSACSNNDSADKPTESKDNQSATSTTPEDNKQENNTPSSNNSTSETEKYMNEINEETATAKGFCGPDLEWYYKDNVLVIKGSGAMADYELSYDTPWGTKSEHDIHKQIHRVIIDDRVTSIGDIAFANFQALSKIKLPDNLERIGAYAFYNTPLTEITIPETVTYIGKHAFENTHLTEIIIPKSVTFLGNFALSVENDLTVTFLGDIPIIGLEEDYKEFLRIFNDDIFFLVLH